ncbi:MAG: cation:proton antiporter [Thermoanaerobaculia bacterium]|nr:cation:proton antiporter [Thermoanaerobaculia bacterium]
MTLLSQLALWVGLPVLGLALLLTLVRIAKGPTLPDRVVGLDLLGTLGMSVAAVLALAAGDAVYIDVAIVLALLSFLGTVAFAVYLERSR